MENLQKGFINVLLLIMILVVAGGTTAYVISKKENPSPPPTPTNEFGQENEQSKTLANTQQDDIKEPAVISKETNKISNSSNSLSQDVTIQLQINGSSGNSVTIKTGENAVITWSAKNVTQCSSGGNGANTWSKIARATSGNFTVSNVQAIGKSQFILICKNANETKSSTVTLDVVSSLSKLPQPTSPQPTIPPTQITPPTSSQPTPEIPKNNAYSYLEKKNIFIVEGDSDIISSGTSASDIGPIDITNSVKKPDLYKKFFSQHPEAKDKYDFIIIATTFKPNNDIGQFDPFKNEITGVGDARTNINVFNLSNYLGFTGKERAQGSAFVVDLNSIGDDLSLLLHEVSHRWLFHLGDYDSCGKGFGCTRKTGYAINRDGGHYNNLVNTKTNISGQSYRDPNGGGSLEMGPVSGYCRDNGGASLYRFTSMSMYLMGLISSTEAQPLKYYETTGGWTEQGIPCIEHTFGINDVVGLVGQRNPSYPSTQKDFSVAYILLTQQGKTPTSSELSRMQFMSDNFPQRWNEATWYKSTISK